MIRTIEWVDKRDRMPTAADADAVGAILAWNVHDGLHLTNPAVFCSHGTFYTHWATPPEGPKGDGKHVEGTDNLKSETGRTVRDYMLAAVEAAGSGRKLAEAIGRNKERIYKWASGDTEPKVRTLLEIEEKSGVSLDEYLPEIRRGMRAAEEIRKAGRAISRRDMTALGIGRNGWSDFLRGDRAADGLSLTTLFAVCRFYEGKIKPLPKPPRKKPRPAAQGELVVKAESKWKMAYGFYKQVMGTGDVRDFDFGEAADGIYRFRTAHYDGIIDLRAMELRVIFRKTGRISVRRDLHAGQALPVPRL